MSGKTSRNIFCLSVVLLGAGFALAKNVTISFVQVETSTNYIPENATLESSKPKLRVKVEIVAKRNEEVLANFHVEPKTNRDGNVDAFEPSVGDTDSEGKFSTVLKTKEKLPALKVRAGDGESEEHNMLPAEYKTQFAITGYYTPTDSGGSATSATLTTSNPQKRYHITSAKAGSELEFKRPAQAEVAG